MKTLSKTSETKIENGKNYMVINWIGDCFFAYGISNKQEVSATSVTDKSILNKVNNILKIKN